MLCKSHTNLSIVRPTNTGRQFRSSAKNRNLTVSMVTFCLLSCSTTSSTSADEIYKIVDEDGNVSYTSEAPIDQQDSKLLKTLPEPSEQEIAEARERQQSIEDDLKETQEAIRQTNNNSAQSESSGLGGSTIIVQPNPAVLVNPNYNRNDRRYPNHPHPGQRPNRSPAAN